MISVGLKFGLYVNLGYLRGVIVGRVEMSSSSTNCYTVLFPYKAESHRSLSRAKVASLIYLQLRIQLGLQCSFHFHLNDWTSP